MTYSTIVPISFPVHLAALSSSFVAPCLYDTAQEKSRGMYLHDARTGKDYLDCFSMFASWPVGHNHPKLTDPKFREVRCHPGAS